MVASSERSCYYANITARRHGAERPRHGEGAITQLGEPRDQGPPRDGLEAGESGRGGALLPGSLHAGGARGDGTPLAGGEAGRPGAAVSRGEPADGRLDDDGD